MSSRQGALLWLALALPPAAAQRLNEVNAAEVADRLLLDDRPVLVAPAVQDAIRSLGERLVGSSGNPERLRFTFTVLNDPVPNGFSFPGGYVYVTSGLLAIAESRDEVAAVLAHEVAHVNAEDWTRIRFRKPDWGEILKAALGAVVMPQIVNACVAEPIECGGLLILGLFDTESFNELWADELAVDYLRKAGFDANALAAIVGKASAGWHHDWPPEKQMRSEERIRNIRRLTSGEASAKPGR